MTRCPCGCGRESKPGSKYAHPATCRPRAFKLRRAQEGLTRVELKRLRDRERKRAARAAGPIRSDDRVSFERAVRVLTDYLCQRWPEDLGPAVEELLEVEAREVLSRARPKR